MVATESQITQADIITLESSPGAERKDLDLDFDLKLRASPAQPSPGTRSSHFSPSNYGCVTVVFSLLRNVAVENQDI